MEGITVLKMPLLLLFYRVSFKLDPVINPVYSWLYPYSFQLNRWVMNPAKRAGTSLSSSADGGGKKVAENPLEEIALRAFKFMV